MIPTQPFTAPVPPPPAPPEAARARLTALWPAPVAATAAVLTVSDVADARSLAYLLLSLPVMYLAIAVTRRAWTSWPVVVGVLVGYNLLEAVGVDPVPVLVAAGLALAVFGLAHGSLRGPGLFALQAPALPVFGGAAVAALYASPGAALVIVALGLLAHAAWDAFHWWRGQVISTSLAQWCIVFDTAVGLGVLVLL
ncbi:hypothetical protein [Nocardiopsis sp. FR6]|uniref:hypothetical protein n=1 Tax=Nocardiopsis sp. FR6 TaxID=2605986 RepID=UPI00135B1FE9|nr:hypothetical protein [Nocardiopsis sp. FR6]